MDSYTLILVTDERSPVRRVQLEKRLLRRGIGGAVALALLFLLGTWDYWRLRAQNAELIGYRLEATEQREQIRSFESTLANTNQHLDRVLAFERKVRIIANLPEASARGGEMVTEIGPGASADAEPVEVPLRVPAGVPVGPTDPASAPQDLQDDQTSAGLSSRGAREIIAMGKDAEVLTERASWRGDALEGLIDQLEDKRNQLLSMPSVWPAKGWLTSRYGHRISPFTGLRQHHSGIDISAQTGTPIVAPGRGRVSFVGRRGPLGRSLAVDHGFGVRTVYGHTSKIHVKIGDSVERGQLIANIGTTGRSTGPHLHYIVEVDGKHADPLDYIFN